MEIGERIALLRRHRNLRQLDLAEKLYVSPKTISKWENGYGLPDIRILPQLAAQLGTDADFLLSGDSAKEQSYREELLAKESAERDRPEALPAKKKVFALYFHTVLHHRLTLWILLCNVALLVLFFLSVPIVAKNAADGGELYYSVLSLLYPPLTEGSPDLAAEGCASAVHILWLVAFFPLVFLSVLTIVRQLRGENEGGLLLASIQFGTIFLLFLTSCIGSFCVNFIFGEIYLYPGRSFAFLLLFAFIHFILQMFVGSYGKPIFSLRLITLSLSALLTACAISGCILPHTAVPTELDLNSIQVRAWNIQTVDSDSPGISDETGGQKYNCVVHSLLTVQANAKIESVTAVNLSYRRTSSDGETESEQTYFLIAADLRETVRRDGAYDNVFSVDMYLIKNEGETLSDFRFSFIVTRDAQKKIFSAESSSVL